MTDTKAGKQKHEFWSWNESIWRFQFDKDFEDFTVKLVLALSGHGITYHFFKKSNKFKRIYLKKQSQIW